MRSPLPQGVDENGVCYDEALYEEYLKSQGSRQNNARLEEVNINHHHQELGGDEPEFY